MSLVKNILHLLNGFRKFLLGIIALSILIGANVIYLIIFIQGKLTGDQLIEAGVKSFETIGIIVAAFMTANLLAKTVGAVQLWLKKK